MGIFNLGPPIGSALGVAFGASLAAAFDWRVPFYVVGAIGIITAVIVYLFIPEPERSEEHTSELKSLMRISYAVFRLQQQNKTPRRTRTHCLSHDTCNTI